MARVFDTTADQSQRDTDAGAFAWFQDNASDKEWKIFLQTELNLKF